MSRRSCGAIKLLSMVPLSASSCSCWSGSGPSVVFDCSDNCDCGGGCQASGTGGLEDAEFAVTGGVCRCSRPDEPHEDEPPPPPDPLVGGLSVSFSKGAVIFEDEYRNTENGPLVPRRSTTTRLTVSASGGPLGGSFTLPTRNLEKLINAGGPGPVALTPARRSGPTGPIPRPSSARASRRAGPRTTWRWRVPSPRPSRAGPRARAPRRRWSGWS